MRRQLTCVLCATVSALSFAETENSMDKESKSAYNVIESSYAESVLRETMITNAPFAVGKLFTDDAAVKWNAFTEKHLSGEQVRDFFVGAVQLRGPVGEKASVGGFYNPWWDAILVVESSGDTVSLPGGEVNVRKVGDFRFLSGESFRGEAHADVPSVESVAPAVRRIPYAVADLAAKTRRRFEAMYAEGVPLMADHPDSDDENNVMEFECRSAMRLKMAQNLNSDTARHKEAWQLAKLLKDGRKGTFDLVFSSDYAKMMSAKFVTLPKAAREGFEPYAYYSSKDGSNVRTYVFVNVRHPRLFALAHLGLGLHKTVFEWFDFARADEIFKAFKMAEEVQK